MKKISLLLCAMLIAVFASTTIFASGESEVAKEEVAVPKTTAVNETSAVSETAKIESNPMLSEASKTTQKNLTSKEEEIQKYMKPREEGGSGLSRTNATVLYYLHLIQLYSYPVCFVGLAIASLNFFIIGNKKLEKREQGFRMLVTLIVGLIVFQVLPLLFAIIVAGR